MLKQKFNTGGLPCLCSLCPGSKIITYILYPMDILDEWVSIAAKALNTTVVVVTGMDWDNDLTPWPAQGVPKGCPPFEGRAAAFITRLSALVSEVEKRFGMTVGAADRNLVGVSLSGLFTLWQWAGSDIFGNIASLSGSFWYQGFMDWFNKQDFTHKKGVAYFLLGNKESSSNVKAFDSVGINTEAIVQSLKAAGVATTFEMVPGNHYQHPIERLNRAMSALTVSVS